MKQTATLTNLGPLVLPADVKWVHYVPLWSDHLALCGFQTSTDIGPLGTPHPCLRSCPDCERILGRKI